MSLECFRSVGCCITSCQMEIGECVVLCLKSKNLTIPANLQDHKVILGCFRSTGCCLTTCQNGIGEWVVLLVYYLKSQKNYNICKFTRAPSDSGMLPLNSLLFKYLQNRNWWVGCALDFFKISKTTFDPNSQEHQAILECFHSVGCCITSCQMEISGG